MPPLPYHRKQWQLRFRDYQPYPFSELLSLSSSCGRQMSSKLHKMAAITSQWWCRLASLLGKDRYCVFAV